MIDEIELREICELITKGTTPSSGDGGFTEFGVNYIKSESLSYDGTIDASKFAFISNETNEKLKRSQLCSQDILYSIAGANLGKCGLVQPFMLPANTNQAVAVIRVDKEKAEFGFVFHFLRSPKQVAWVLGGVAQSAQPNLNLGDLGRVKLPKFSRNEQRAIAGVLSAIDNKIELNLRMNETLEGMAQAIFKDWFVDFGPVRRKVAGVTDPIAIMGGITQDHAGAAGLSSLFPDGFGDDGLPEGWSNRSAIDLADWVNGAAYKNMHFVGADKGLPVVKIAELKNGVTSQTKYASTDLGDRYRIDDGELLFSWSGNPDTSIDTFIWAGGPAWLNQHIFAVRPNDQNLVPYLYVLLKWLRPTFAELARNKQTTGLGHVTKDDLKRLDVITASPELRVQFLAFISPVFERLKSTLFENRTLAETRNYLLPRLMSGEVRVRDAEKLVEGDVA